MTRRRGLAIFATGARLDDRGVLDLLAVGDRKPSIAHGKSTKAPDSPASPDLNPRRSGPRMGVTTAADLHPRDVDHDRTPKDRS
ncbi:hypothetical protein FHW64_004513 [Variovorax sp. Sphag1AA]|nr:hypothetical protein [Variovorax sp. Sphag1AA]